MYLRVLIVNVAGRVVADMLAFLWHHQSIIQCTDTAAAYKHIQCPNVALNHTSCQQNWRWHARPRCTRGSSCSILINLPIYEGPPVNKPTCCTYIYLQTANSCKAKHRQSFGFFFFELNFVAKWFQPQPTNVCRSSRRILLKPGPLACSQAPRQRDSTADTAQPQYSRYSSADTARHGSQR
jgi:hypothetical protein